MLLTGGALERLEALTPPGRQAQIDLTITDEGPMALAFVIISAVGRLRPDRRGGLLQVAATTENHASHQRISKFSWRS